MAKVMTCVFLALALAVALLPESDPGPTPSPVPGVVVPADGLRVLFVRPENPTSSGNVERAVIPQSGAVQDWLKANGATYENYVGSQDLGKADDGWKIMYGLPRTDERWMVVANRHKVVFSGPWPESIAATVALLDKLK